jgi:hypothetical protein
MLSPALDPRNDRQPRDGRPVPRWAHIVAHLIPLTTLPSGLWRVGIASGLSLGMLDHGEPLHIHGWESVYLVCLSLAIEGLALLAFGLVQPWGERVPRRMPWIGGRRIPPRLVVGIAGTGAFLATTVALMFFLPSDNMGQMEATDTGLAVAIACYLPLVLWGPLVLVLTVAYQRRRCR